jgi:hypothetical protein
MNAQQRRELAGKIVCDVDFALRMNGNHITAIEKIERILAEHLGKPADFVDVDPEPGFPDGWERVGQQDGPDALARAGLPQPCDTVGSPAMGENPAPALPPSSGALLDAAELLMDLHHMYKGTHPTMQLPLPPSLVLKANELSLVEFEVGCERSTLNPHLVRVLQRLRDAQPEASE